MAEQQQVAPPARPRGSSRGARVALIGIIEIALIALIVVALLGQRIAATGDLIDQIPGGRLVVAGVAAALLLVAALVMTFLVSD
jgi:hypothetical protein